MSLFINIHTENCSEVLHIRYYFEEWRKMNPQSAGTVQLEACQPSTLTFATWWYQHLKEYQSATEDRTHHFPSAKQNCKTTRSLLRVLNLSQVEYVIWPYFVHEYVSLKSYKLMLLKCLYIATILLGSDPFSLQPGWHIYCLLL